MRSIVCVFCLSLLAQSGAWAAGWQIQKMGGRDYLPVSQVAAFYKMGVVSRGERGITLTSGNRRMDFSVGSREARIDGVKHWLSFPIMSFGGRYYVSRMDLSKTIDPAMRPERIPQLKAVHTVVLDPGHGGHDRGAVNRFAPEKHYNLDLCRRIRPYLTRAGLRVVITRSRDEFIPLEARPAVASRLGDGAIFVSVHCNSSSERSSLATGFEIYTLTPRGAPNSNDSYLTRAGFSAAPGHRADYASQALSGAIYHSMLGRVPMFDRGMKRARFAVLRRATNPSVLIECGFMSNPRVDARLLHNAEWRERLAESIALGILEYADLAKTKSPPKLFAQYRAERANDPGVVELEYQPLAGIGSLVGSAFPPGLGWRSLLVTPLGEDQPTFRMDFEPRGIVLLESWSVSGEDARSGRSTKPVTLFGEEQWPIIPPTMPGLGGWRALLPGRTGDNGFSLFPSQGGPLNDGGEPSAGGGLGHLFRTAVEIFGGSW